MSCLLQRNDKASQHAKQLQQDRDAAKAEAAAARAETVAANAKAATAEAQVAAAQTQAAGTAAGFRKLQAAADASSHVRSSI